VRNDQNGWDARLQLCLRQRRKRKTGREEEKKIKRLSADYITKRHNTNDKMERKKKVKSKQASK